MTTSAPSVVDAIRLISLQLGSLTNDSLNPHFKNRYVSLNGLLAEIRPPLAEHGITITSSFSVLPNGQPVITTRLIGAGGDIEESVFPLHGTDAQRLASAATTGQRRNLMALLGLASEDDDDGNTAAGFSAVPQQTPLQPQQFNNLPNWS